MDHGKKGGALCHLSVFFLLVGGLNWGLHGLGMLLKTNLNVVNLLVGRWPTVEAIVYLLVGVMALKVIVFMLMGRKCCACGGSCACGAGEKGGE